MNNWVTRYGWLILLVGIFSCSRRPQARLLPLTIYVPNIGNNSIVEFSSDQNGNAVPLATIRGRKTQLLVPRAVAIEGNGDILVCNGSGVIVRFAPGSQGNIAPISTIEGANTMLTNCAGMALDHLGRIHALDIDVSTGMALAILEFAVKASGNVAPIGLIQGSKTGFGHAFGLAVDHQGNIWTSDATSDNLREFASNAEGNVAPISVVEGPNTQLNTPFGIAFDEFGDLLATSLGKTLMFNPNPSGNVAPARVLPGVAHPFGIASDGLRMFETNIDTSSVNPQNVDASSVDGFLDGYEITQIGGSLTGFSRPEYLALSLGI